MDERFVFLPLCSSLFFFFSANVFSTGGCGSPGQCGGQGGTGTAEEVVRPEDDLHRRNVHYHR